MIRDKFYSYRTNIAYIFYGLEIFASSWKVNLIKIFNEKKEKKN